MSFILSQNLSQLLDSILLVGFHSQTWLKILLILHLEKKVCTDSRFHA